MDNGQVPLTDEHKAYAKRIQRTTQISGLASSVFIRSKNRQNCRNFVKTKWKRTDKGNMWQGC